jgi:uncharacterized protein (TIGR02145 family)
MGYSFEKVKEQYASKCLMKKILNIIILAVILIGFTTFNSCKKDDSAITEIKPPGRVTTSGVLATSSNGAVLAGHVADMGGAKWYIRGVCYDTIPDPDTSTVFVPGEPHDLFHMYDKIFSPGSFIEGKGFSLPNTTYYARTFAVNEAGITYGNQISFTTNPLISDVEGRIYGTESIGTQVWLTENLKTTKFNDGDSIPLVENFGGWRILTSPGYYVFSWSWMEDSWQETLYNWHSVNTGKLCPGGWHIPTWEEWKVFADYVGLSSNKLEQAYNSFIFKACNTVVRDTINEIMGGSTNFTRVKPQWWSSSFSSYSSAWYFTLDLEKEIISEYNKKYGLPVRCVKDN